MGRAAYTPMIKPVTLAYHPASDAGSLSLSNCTATEDTTVLGPHGYSTLKVIATASTEIQVTWVNKSAFNPKGGLLFAVIRFPQSTTGMSRVVLSNGAASLANNKEMLFNTNFRREGDGSNDLWNYLPMIVNDMPDDNYSASGQISTEYGTGIDNTTDILSGRFNFPSAVDGDVFYIEGLFYQSYARPAITFGFDSNGTDIGTRAKPPLDALGWLGYIALEDGAYGLAAEKARVQTYYDAGWDVLPHSVTHTSFTSLTDAQVLSEVNNSISNIESNGWTRGSKLFVYPQGAADGDTCAAMRSTKAIGAFGARGRHVMPSHAGIDNIFDIGRYELGGKTLAQAKAAVDAAIAYGSSLHIYTHQIIAGSADPPGDTLQWAEDNWNALLTYIRLKQNQGLVDVMTMTQWWEKFQLNKNSRVFIS